jgi:multidrug resistance efflux pump
MKRGYILLCLFALIIAGCAQSSSQAQGQLPSTATSDLQESTSTAIEPTLVPLFPSQNSLLVRGHLVPTASIELSFATKGRVDKVLVQNGTSVKEGDVLARLEDQESLDSKVSAAQLDLVSSQQSYDDLQASLPEAQVTALEDLNTAEETLRQIQTQVGNVSNPASPSNGQIEIARANVAIAQKALDKASSDYRPFANKPEDNLTRAALLQKYVSAQDRFNRVLADLNSLLGGNTTSQASDQAQSQLQVAQARVDEALAKYNLLLQGPDPKEVEAAQARLDAAKTALTAAQAELKKLDLHAPMDGTVVNLNLAPGEYISEGESVLNLVDFSKWYVDTDNLVENQVVKISTGQTVTIIPDSLPDLKMKGVVESISSTSQEDGGKVIYTAHILVGKVDPRLRWGMNVQVNFGNPGKQ